MYKRKNYPEEFFNLNPNGYLSMGCRLCYDKDCENDGKCIDPSSTYACKCPIGFTADDCSIDINECEDNKCQNNATCVDKIGKYECDCVLGYEGEL